MWRCFFWTTPKRGPSFICDKPVAMGTMGYICEHIISKPAQILFLYVLNEYYSWTWICSACFLYQKNKLIIDFCHLSEFIYWDSIKIACQDLILFACYNPERIICNKIADHVWSEGCGKVTHSQWLCSSLLACEPSWCTLLFQIMGSMIYSILNFMWFF